MSRRVAVKGLINTEDNRLVLVQGKRWLGLPGGGVDIDERTGKPENTLDTFWREGGEEIGLRADQVSGIEIVGAMRQKVTSRPDAITGVSDSYRARWILVMCRLLVPIDELYIPDPDEVSAITARTPEECDQSTDISPFTLRAIRRFAMQQTVELAGHHPTT